MPDPLTARVSRKALAREVGIAVRKTGQPKQARNVCSAASLILAWNALTADRNRSRFIDRGWPEVGDAALAALSAPGVFLDLGVGDPVAGGAFRCHGRHGL
jgi:hypothetical protein